MSVDPDCLLPGLPARAVLRDGTAICARAIRPDDKARLQAAFARLSPRSVYQRFFHLVNELTIDDLRRFTEIDFRDHVAIVLTVGDESEERLIAVGRYIRVASEADLAEVAFTVADEYQGRGAATLLLRELVATARHAGVRRLLAHVLSENGPMLEVFRRSKLPLGESMDHGTRRLVLDLAAAPARRARRFDFRNAIRTQCRRFADDSTGAPGYART